MEGWQITLIFKKWIIYSHEDDIFGFLTLPTFPSTSQLTDISVYLYPYLPSLVFLTLSLWFLTYMIK